MRAAVRASGLSVQDPLLDHPECRYTLPQLRSVLSSLVGEVLVGPSRTRSLHAKRLVAQALGYEAPPSFRRTVPRLLGPDLDVYVQSSDNLQVWNQQLVPTRRYVVLRPDEAGVVTSLVVTTGADLARLDTTGTLTSKQQARRRPGRSGSALVGSDVGGVLPLLGAPGEVRPSGSVGDLPQRGQVLPVGVVHDRLRTLVGTTLVDPGPGQERRRGEALQRLVVAALGVGAYSNPAQWPDVPSQALEVKLQTSPTVDLGSVCPDSPAACDLGEGVAYRDVRWAVVYAEPRPGGLLEVVSVVTTSGAAFYEEFVPFGGNVVNRKLQLRLPPGFFDPPPSTPAS